MNCQQTYSPVAEEIVLAQGDITPSWWTRPSQSMPHNLSQSDVHEANRARHFSRDAEVSSTLRCGFLPIWSEILRRVRRSDFGKRRRAMHPPQLKN